MRARDRLSKFLAAKIQQRRETPGPDIFSAVCNTTDDDGRTLEDETIVRHMNLLFMAAHDTTASALTSLVYLLGRHPGWQTQVREELVEWRASRHVIDQEGLQGLSTTEMVLNEALRLMPPVPSLPRGLTQDVNFAGYTLEKGATVGLHILHTHHMADLWPAPEQFDPKRFAPQKIGDRHRYAWLPFGGGSHMCLGLHFASMQVKIILAELLSRRSIVLGDGYEADMKWLPIAHPRDGLPVELPDRSLTVSPSMPNPSSVRARSPG